MEPAATLATLMLSGLNRKAPDGDGPPLADRGTTNVKGCAAPEKANTCGLLVRVTPVPPEIVTVPRKVPMPGPLRVPTPAAGVPGVSVPCGAPPTRIVMDWCRIG